MEQPPPITENPPPVTQEPTMSLAGRMFNVLATPGDVFDEVKAMKPCAANWVVPALVATLLGWIACWLIFSQPAIQQQISEMTSKAVEKQLAKAHVSGEQAERAREMGEKYGAMGMKLSAYLAPPFASFVAPFWWGLIIWLVGAKMLKGDFVFMKTVEAAGLAGIVSILDAIIRTALIFLTGNLFAAPGLVMLVNDYDPQNPVHALLGLGNIMTFWVLAVRALALARLASVSFWKAAVWAFGIWLAYMGLFIGLGFGIRALTGQ
jgi:hypothetical protein